MRPGGRTASVRSKRSRRGPRARIAACARSWDLPGARTPERRAGAVIFLAQLPLRPLLSLLARPRWIGREHLPATGGAILAGNHTGPLDALAYGHLLQAGGIAPRFLAKEALFRVPLLGALLRASGQVPVHRGTRRGRDALSSAREALGRGEAMMVFPEGTYTRDPGEWPMRARTGAARLALSTGAPLVPIALWGSRAVWPIGAALPRPFPRRRLIARIGEPIRAEARPGESTQEASLRLTDELMEAITVLLAETRGQKPPATRHDPRRDPLRPESGQRLSAADRRRLALRAAVATTRSGQDAQTRLRPRARAAGDAR